MQAENRLVKRLLFAAVVVIILMFAGMFAFGMVTAELAKEMKEEMAAQLAKEVKAQLTEEGGGGRSSLQSQEQPE